MKKRDVKRVIDALVEHSDEIEYLYTVGALPSEKGTPDLLFTERAIDHWLRRKKDDSYFLESLTESDK